MCGRVAVAMVRPFANFESVYFDMAFFEQEMTKRTESGQSRRDFIGRPDFSKVLEHNLNRFFGRIDDLYEIKIASADVGILFERGAHPFAQSGPVIAPIQNQRETRNPPRLHQREDFIKFVERAE